MTLRIHEDVFARLSTAQLRTIVRVSWKKAFDNVHHQHLLNKLIPTQPCVRMTVRLTCSSEKSEYITILNSHTSKADAYRAIVQLNMADEPIPRHKFIRILEFIRQQEGGRTDWLRRTLTQVGQITHTMTRVSKRLFGSP
ncbi:hypothetical protein HPB47_001543 [Ixodes persulcatus]|uniref:Uncharacterized protein n=1 Tax=Ixodes persulcatus TaxID=34615 RepID=A0AC60PNU4_IXOPE|nr:hypothetical protein HPB47_001543 [Ixodes persulcatus]